MGDSEDCSIRDTAEQAIGCAVLDMLAEEDSISGFFTIQLLDDKKFSLCMWSPLQIRTG